MQQSLSPGLDMRQAKRMGVSPENLGGGGFGGESLSLTLSSVCFDRN